MASQQLQPSFPFDTPAPSLVGLNAESGTNTPKTPPNDQTLLAPDIRSDAAYTEKTAVHSRLSNRTKWILVAAAACIVAIIVIIVPVYFTVIKPKKTPSENVYTPNSSNGNGNNPESKGNGNTTGGDGSTVFTATGNFTYKNPFGGFWVYDPKDPFNNRAKAQVCTHLGAGGTISDTAPRLKVVDTRPE
jgi:glucan 1,3-beta-glucosidase